MFSIKYLERFYVYFRNSWQMRFERCKNIPIKSLYCRLALYIYIYIHIYIDIYISILNKNVSTTYGDDYSVIMKVKTSRKKCRK